MSQQGKLLFEKFVKFSRKGALLQSISYLLDWDQETMMPPDAIDVRSLQQSLLATLIHKEKTSGSFKTKLNQLIDLESGEIKHSDISYEQAAALRMWRSDYLKDAKLPASFIKKFAKLSSEASHVWSSARRHNQFKDFAPYLSKIVDLCRKKADFLGYTHHPYDALLDLYEPGMQTERLTTLFSHLKITLPSFLKCIGTQRPPEALPVNMDFDTQKQMKLGEYLLDRMGFKKSGYRLNLSTHPFCCPVHPNDIRMTTRLSEGIISHIYSVIHEGGHALYARNRPADKWGTPLGDSCSLGIDESQSRLWETTIGKSKAFCTFLLNLLQEYFPNPFATITLDKFYASINHVKPSFIRVASDEISYGLHIILRFEIEKALVEGTLKVKEIPEVWNQKMVEYLGIMPKTDADGCLQDIHWSLGAIGYFPTYALGNLYAAQFFETFCQEDPGYADKIQAGDFSSISHWFKEKVHKHGRCYLPHQLIEKVTNKPLSEEAFLRYLKKKYKDIYDLSDLN